MILNSVLVIGVIAGMVLLYNGCRLGAQIALVVGMVALFLNRPSEVFLNQYGQTPAQAAAEPEEHGDLIRTPTPVETHIQS